MQKRILALLMTALLCTVTGCNVKKITDETPGAAQSAEKTATAQPLRREDALGNPVRTMYAEGAFVSAEAGKLIVEVDGTPREFSLSQRATNDVSGLGIVAGTRLIVNYNVLEDGTEEAESLEKIIAE